MTTIILYHQKSMSKNWDASVGGGGETNVATNVYATIKMKFKTMSHMCQNIIQCRFQRTQEVT